MDTPNPTDTRPREILVPIGSRELEADPRGTLGPARFTAEQDAADAGWTLPDHVDPQVVGTYHEAADLSAWARRMIETSIGNGDDLSDLAFAYWRWEANDE